MRLTAVVVFCRRCVASLLSQRATWEMEKRKLESKSKAVRRTPSTVG
nr:hypothetical protein [Ktedonobacter sp. SOSP1-52]